MTVETAAYATLEDKAAVERVPLSDRLRHTSVFAMLRETAAEHPTRPAVSFQIKSGPKDRALTLTWAEMEAEVARTANLLRGLGVGEGDAVAYLLPNCTDTVLALIGGLTAGIVVPINPLLEVEQIAGILRETEAKVLITLAPFPKTDVAQKGHAAAAQAPSVAHVLEVDLKRYLSPPLSWIVPFLRPRLDIQHKARVQDFAGARAAEPATLQFEESADRTRIAANFHTGGTTGLPKIAQHTQEGMIYNGVMPTMYLIGPDDVLICPLPLFHVLGAHPVIMSCIASGAHVVLPTPAGYRGDGVMDNFWALIERWGVTFMVMVPTAASALMQRKVAHDVSTLKYALCGSAPLPVELFRRFEERCGVKILEGYGMTEATCLVSINPPHGERKIGSVGIPIPYTDVKILHCADDGTTEKECATDEIGEICIQSPAVFPGYREEVRNFGVFAEPGHALRTGDLGRIDADGYLWITGRKKDLIIRGGHNIDPALIEETLMGHRDVAFVGAIGQPDAVSGELPAAYVELRRDAEATVEDLLAYARTHVPERAAVPKHLEILDDLPKTAVGKVFKPALRKSAIARVLTAALAEKGIVAEIEVREDKSRGLVAHVASAAGEAAVAQVLGEFATPWEWAG